MKTASKPVLAVFDFDGTVTYSDSLRAFLRFLFGRRHYIGHVLRLLPTLVRFRLGILGNHVAKERALVQTIGGSPASMLETRAMEFADSQLDSLLRKQAMDRIQWHKRAGHQVWICSASPEIYLRPWIDRHGLDGLCGTKLEISDQHYTGRLEGANCWGPEKVHRLQEELGDLAEFEVYAYGDTKGDHQLLSVADHAYFQPFRGKDQFDS